MIRFRVYVRIDGEQFDAERFQHSLDANVQSTVETTHRMSNGMVERYRTYWRSEVRWPVEEEPEDALLALLVDYRATILRAKACHATRIMAQVVGEHEPDALRGFYVSEELIRLLAELGASLDIDNVWRLA